MWLVRSLFSIVCVVSEREQSMRSDVRVFGCRSHRRTALSDVLFAMHLLDCICPATATAGCSVAARTVSTPLTPPLTVAPHPHAVTASTGS